MTLHDVGVEHHVYTNITQEPIEVRLGPDTATVAAGASFHHTGRSGPMCSGLVTGVIARLEKCREGLGGNIPGQTLDSERAGPDLRHPGGRALVSAAS